MEEIGGVFVVGLGINEGQPAGFAVGKGGDGADLGNEAGGLLGELLGVGQAVPAGIKATGGVDHGRQDGHGMGGGRKAFEMVLHVLVQIFVLREHLGEFAQLLVGGEFSVDDEVGGFDKTGFDGQFLDGDAAVTQDALLAVNEGDGAFAGARCWRNRHPG